MNSRYSHEPQYSTLSQNQISSYLPPTNPSNNFISSSLAKSSYRGFYNNDSKKLSQ
jgi:hypothetical protein